MTNNEERGIIGEPQPAQEVVGRDPLDIRNFVSSDGWVNRDLAMLYDLSPAVLAAMSGRDLKELKW